MGDSRIVVLVSANSEWRAVKSILNPAGIACSPMGETFEISPLIYFHGGWGKISAAATTQYAIDRFKPELIINLGTCGGFEGLIARGTIILATKTIVYDIIEQMSDPDEAIAHYSTDLDLAWLDERGPIIPDNRHAPIMRGLLISADRDIVPKEIPDLVNRYGAMAADWESGAIAWVSSHNKVRCLILRGVSDLISAEGGEAYGNIQLFHENTHIIMQELITLLPYFLK